MPRRAQPSFFAPNPMTTISILAFIGTVALGGFHMVDNVATKPYVLDRVEEVTVAAKLREQAILEKSIDHSDRNHDDMILKMQLLSSEVKAQSTKLDTLLDYEKTLKGIGR